MNNQELFTKLLNINGSHLDKWNSEDAQWAKNFIASNEAARIEFDNQCALEKMLTDHVPHTMDEHLVGAITKNIRPKVGTSWIWGDWLTQSVWRPLFAASLPLIIGILGGIYYPQESFYPQEATTSAESIALLAFSDLSEEYQDEE